MKKTGFSRAVATMTLAMCVGATMVMATQVRADDTFRVAYAGSMGVVMDKGLGPAFAQREHVTYQGQGEGAYGLARLLASGRSTVDVFVSITPGPMAILKDAGLIDEAVPVASTRMVIAYNPKGRFGEAFRLAGADAAHPAWWKVLQTPGLRFGRTDPATDPQGQDIVFTLMLAQKYYEQAGLAQSVLGDVRNPQQVFGEGGLLTRLEAGQVDAASGYESATRSAKLPYVALPDEINLSNPVFSKSWYDTVSFTLPSADGKEKTVRPQALVFYAAKLKNAAHPKAADDFLAFMTSSQGQKLFDDNGYGKPKGDALYH
ncbi:extracellular solute-binding protein [Pandoraea commovens]|uniref:Extracellular solute-binding protein n=1 Tax=Pandoraea commovens TaxID=2508289 RepID=A0ABY5Q9N7_9BURK|nr:extracellular solute-binding protein [Pandoraea commovens]UVA77289.1 extracellular solute-binding protein [Pandoraea commovens]